MEMADLCDSDADARRVTRSTDRPEERSRRRRGAEPVRFAQLQAEDIEMSKLRYQQQLRKGEKRRLDHPSKTSKSSSDSKRARAAARRTARQARRREAMSPRSDADSDSSLWQSLPSLALDGSGPHSRRPANPEDAVHTTVLHPTSWRRVYLPDPPTNLLPPSVMEAFATALDQPLASYSPELEAQCAVMGESDMNHAQSLDSGNDEDDLQSTVRLLLSEAQSKAKDAHANRVNAVLQSTRQGVRACLREIREIREHRILSIASKLQPLSVTPLERAVASTLLTNQSPPTAEELVDVMPTYMVGRGESSIRERAHLPKELVLLHRLPAISRSTTCIGVATTLPVDDDPIIRYVPQFAHMNKADTASLAQFTNLEALHKASVSVLDDDANELVLRYVVGAVGGDTRVFRVLRELSWAVQPQADYHELQKQALAERALSEWRANSRLSLRQRLRRPTPPTPPTVGGSAFRRLLCRRCYVYNCQQHGANQPLPQTRIDPVYPPVKTTLSQPVSEVDHAIDADAMSQTLETDEVTAASTSESVETEDMITVVDANGDVTMECEAVRRSVRSVTAAATKASSFLVSQLRKLTPTRRPSGGGSRAARKDDVSEYLGYEGVYRSITSARRSALLVSNAAGCSTHCHKTQLDANVSNSSWSVAERTLLHLAKKAIGTNSCAIACVIQLKTCTEVAHQLRQPPTADDLVISAAIQSDVVSVRANSQEHLQRTRFQRMKDRGSNHQYLPCSHAGSCDTNACSCMRRDHFCEKACGCARDCANRFPGCRCPRGECGTAACPCFFSGRECDPDLCATCGACEVPLLAGLDPASSRQKVCTNTNLLRGAHRHIAMAESTTHGWGAFAMEDVAEGEFIYEYTGELLTQDEAERRGNVYDRNAVSFLFDLNEDAVVDAARKGNKSKFANHSSADANCAARIMLVNGDHRIGLYAKRHIAKGEELFFDYGHHGVVPDWSQSRIRSNGVGATAWSAPTLPTSAAVGAASPTDTTDEIVLISEGDEEEEESGVVKEDEDGDVVMAQ